MSAPVGRSAGEVTTGQSSGAARGAPPASPDRSRWAGRPAGLPAVERAGLKSLNEGQRISFDVEPDKKGKGPKAVNLVVSG